MSPTPPLDWQTSTDAGAMLRYASGCVSRQRLVLAAYETADAAWAERAEDVAFIAAHAVHSGPVTDAADVATWADVVDPSLDLADALTANRINWTAIVDAGHDLEAIRDDAAAHGDTSLVRKADRAIARRAPAPWWL